MTGFTRTIQHILHENEYIITPRLDTWLTNNNELVLTDEDVDLLRILLTTKGRNRAGSFTGSQAGDCSRRQMFRYLGIPPLGKIDPVLQNIFFDGTWRHLRWQFTLRHVFGAGFNIETPVYANSQRFIGSLDGFHETEKWGWEHKGTSAFGKVVLGGIMDPHKLQAARYWLATDEDPNYPRLDKWVFTYESKYGGDWKEIVIKRDDPEVQRIFKSVRIELQDLNEDVDAQRLPNPLKECENGRGPTFKACGWHHVCLSAQWPNQTAGAPGNPIQIGRRKKKPGHTVPPISRGGSE